MVRVNVGENFKMTMEVHTMIIKKFGSIIVAAALIVTVFSGCGSKAPEPTPVGKPYAGGLRYTDRIAVGKPGG